MLIVAWILPAASWAQSANQISSIYENLGIYLLGGLTLFISLAAIFTVIKVVESFVRPKESVDYEEQQTSANLAAASATGEDSWWKRMYKQATKAVPVAREKEILLDHNYDGIQELDNNLPPWWLAMFYITVAFGIVYYGYNHWTSYGISSSEAWAMEMQEAEEAIAAFRSGQAVAIDETNVTVMDDPAELALGEQLYNTNCAVCHLNTGAGLVGPNLTDEYWIHGGGIKNIFSTIKYGVPEKGMISWSSQMRPADMQRVASYILTLEGTNPPNPKEPQGEIWTPEAQ